MSKPCKQPNCMRLGSSHCSACQGVWYCGVECQRANWKDHKITCRMKLLTVSELDEYLEDKVHEVSHLDLDDKSGKLINDLRKNILIAEYQLGDQLPGSCCRKRKNGEIFENDWALYILRDLLTDCYLTQNTATSCDIALSYATENRAQLEMKRSNDNNPVVLFYMIIRANSKLGEILLILNRREEALFHAQEALAAARATKDSSKIISTLQNVHRICLMLQNELHIKYAEEAYNVASGQHGPEHPDVQRVANDLISSCLAMGNFADAERFARITYECLINPSGVLVSDESIAIAKRELARVWLYTPSELRIGGPEVAEEAETLARESCDILEKIIGRGGFDEDMEGLLSGHYSTLIEVMVEKGQRNSEVERMILRALSFTTKCRKGSATHKLQFVLLQYLTELYCASIHVDIDVLLGVRLLERARRAYEESIRIGTAVYGSDHDKLLGCTSKLKEIDYAIASLRVERGLNPGEEGWKLGDRKETTEGGREEESSNCSISGFEECLIADNENCEPFIEYLKKRVPETKAQSAFIYKSYEK